MAKPPASDYGRDLGKLEGSVDVLKTMTFTIIGFLTAIVGGGIFLLVQINNVRNELISIHSELSQRMDRLESALTELKGGQTAANGSLARIEKKLADALPLQPTPPTGIALTSDQIQFLHSVLKFDPDLAFNGIGQLGQVLSDVKLFDFPADVIERIPALKGTQYTFDFKQRILVVSSADRRVVAVV